MYQAVKLRAQASSYIYIHKVIVQFRKAFVKFASHPNLSDTDCTSDGEESVNTENESDSLIAQKSLIITKNKRLSLVLAKIDEAIKEIISTNGQSKPRRNIDPAAVDKDDFDCALCFR